MKLKKAVATITAMATMSSMFAMTAFAEGEWNTNGGKAEITGESTAYQPTIEVELPGDLTFGLNPLKLNVSEDPAKPDKSQIISGDYFVNNLSNVPVAVRTTTFVVASNDVELKTAADLSSAWNTIKELNPAANKKKAVLLTQLYPAASGITSTEEGFSMKVENIKPGAAANSIKGDILATSTDNAGAGITYQPIFVLNAYNEAKPLESVGGFKFDGAVDPNANFVEEDITIKAVFELKALTAGQITDMFEGYKSVTGNTTATYYTTIKKLKTGKTW